jgi:hypothetical protein
VPHDFLSFRSLKNVHINQRAWFLSTPGYRQQDLAARSSLIRHLRTRGAELASSDSEAAGRYVRAAIILTAQDRFEVGPFHFTSIIQDESMLRLAGLRPDGTDLIRKIAARLAQQEEVAREDRINAYEASRALIASPKDAAVWSREGPRFLKAIETAWDKSTERTDERFTYANMLWRFNCLARSVGDDQTLRSVGAAVASMRKRTVDPDELRWLDEVLAIPGPAPTSPGIKIIRHPDEMKPGTP